MVKANEVGQQVLLAATGSSNTPQINMEVDK
jgi:hypothetical protein